MTWAVVLALLGQTAPPELACLVQHYGLTAEQDARGQWGARGTQGEWFLWDDGAAKSFEQQLASPDLQDTLALNADLSRVRHPGLFTARYGPPTKVELRTVHFFGTRVRVHVRIAPALERVIARLQLHPNLRSRLTDSAGGYVNRPIAGTERLSAHAFGIALDLDSKRADYWRWSKDRVLRHPIPKEIVEAFEAEGFLWGGHWYHYDTMHFEYRPELTGPERCLPEPAPSAR